MQPRNMEITHMQKSLVKQYFHRSLGIFGALTLAMLWVTTPLLFSSTAQAQDTQQVASAGQVNVNTASAESLATALKGVGLSRAQEIVRHREVYAPLCFR